MLSRRSTVYSQDSPSSSGSVCPRDLPCSRTRRLGAPVWVRDVPFASGGIGVGAGDIPFWRLGIALGGALAVCGSLHGASSSSSWHSPLSALIFPGQHISFVLVDLVSQPSVSHLPHLLLQHTSSLAIPFVQNLDAGCWCGPGPGVAGALYTGPRHCGGTSP